MLIFGTRSAHIGLEKDAHATCAECGAEGTLQYSVFRRHAHLFWVPMFPIGKTGSSVCANCKNVLTEGEMQPDRLKSFRKVKKEAKGPVWQFVGIVLLLTLIGWSQISSIQSRQKQVAYMASPQTGDVYYLKSIKSSGYTSWLVESVSADSVWLFMNDYEIDRKSQVEEIDIYENYKGPTVGFSRKRMQQFYDEEAVFKVIR